MRKPQLSELTLREKIGQTGCISSGALVGNKTRKELIERNCFGALWVTGDQDFMKDYMSYENGNFGHKPTAEEANSWVHEIIPLFKLPPLLPSDGETGIGTARVGMSYLTRGVGYFWADKECAKLYEKCGELVGTEFRACTLNWIFAPVCDVVKGDLAKKTLREYPEDYARTSDMTSRYIKGVQSKGVAACIKHFPSPGPYESRNTHISPSSNDMSLEEWMNTQGKIYQRAIDEGVMTIMSSHTSFPAVDDTLMRPRVHIPSSLSSKVLIGLLKEKMGFKGVVVTDDLSMRAARLHYNEENLFVEYLKAGNDLLLGIIDPNYTDIVEKAVKEGRLSEERINDACQRILDLKEKLGMFDDDYQYTVPLADNHFEELEKHNLEVSKKAIVEEINTSMPFKNVKNVGIVIQNDAPESIYIHFKNALEEKGINVEVKRRLLYIDDLPNLVKGKDVIVYFLGDNYEHTTVRWMLTEEYKKSVVVAVASPTFYEETAVDAENFLHVYSCLKETQRALADKIIG